MKSPPCCQAVPYYSLKQSSLLFLDIQMPQYQIPSGADDIAYTNKQV